MPKKRGGTCLTCLTSAGGVVLVLLATLNFVAAQDLQPAATVDISSEAEFLAALGSPAVTTLEIMNDIIFSAHAVVPGCGPNGLYNLTRNVTVRALTAQSRGWYPRLDFSRVESPKLSIPAGIHIWLQHVITTHDPTSLGYSWTMLDPASRGSLVSTDIIRVIGLCPPLSWGLQILRAIPRPPQAPGTQRVSALATPFCAPRPPANGISSPSLDTCWNVGVAVADYVIASRNLASVEPAYPQPVSQAISAFINSSFVCDQVITIECAEQYGLSNCTTWYLSHMQNGSALPPPPSPPCTLPMHPLPPYPPALVPPYKAALSASQIVGAAVGTAVGGAVLAVLGLFFARCVRRRLRAGTSKDPQPSSFGTSDDLEAQAANQAASPVDRPASTSLSDSPVDFAAISATTSGTEASAVEVAPHHPCSAGSANTKHSSHRMDYIMQLSEMSQRLETSIQDNELCIQAVIGRGAFGTVYRGSWKGLPVAVKSLLFTSDTPDGGAAKKDRVFMEAALSKSISHPNVVTTYACDLKPITVNDTDSALGSCGMRVINEANVLNHWRIFIIQELCDGGSLRHALDNHLLAVNVGHVPEIPLMVVIELAAGLANGMTHLHERNVVHGDLNPANVLLKRVGNYRMVPKVCDFGFSVHLAADTSHVSNIKRGTPLYVAPEIALCGQLSRPADVYAMGVMLWELYMGMPRWKASTVGGPVSASRTFPQLPGEAPAWYQHLVIMCLDPNPAQRPTFSSILDLLLAMRQEMALQGGPATASTSAQDVAHPASRIHMRPHEARGSGDRMATATAAAGVMLELTDVTESLSNHLSGCLLNSFHMEPAQLLPYEGNAAGNADSPVIDGATDGIAEAV